MRADLSANVLLEVLGVVMLLLCEALKDQAEVRSRQKQTSVSCSELGLGTDPASDFLGDAG